MYFETLLTFSCHEKILLLYYYQMFFQQEQRKTKHQNIRKPSKQTPSSCKIRRRTTCSAPRLRSIPDGCRRRRPLPGVVFFCPALARPRGIPLVLLPRFNTSLSLSTWLVARANWRHVGTVGKDWFFGEVFYGVVPLRYIVFESWFLRFKS